jgi:hypothetical protein
MAGRTGRPVSDQDAAGQAIRRAGGTEMMVPGRCAAAEKTRRKRQKPGKCGKFEI